MGGGGDVTIGYKYYVGMHMVLCHGPVDSVQKIRVGDDDDDVWDTPVSSSQQIFINKPNIFGGEKKEGGVKGYVDVAMGESTQQPNDYLVRHLGPDKTPGYRGVVSLILRQVYVSAMSSYIKRWSAYVRRCGGAMVGDGDMNPAQIIRECLTNAEWGMGYPDGDVDTASFDAAAGTLLSEGLGLSLLWSNSTKIEDFVSDVLKHIAGVLYVDIFTGKFVLQLLRDDYDAESLPVLDKTNVVAVQSYARRSESELINTVILSYTDGPTNKKQSVTVHNMGLLQTQGQIIAEELTFNGISNAATAMQVAARELRRLSAELSVVQLTVNRTMIGLRLGDAFKLSWPEYGVASEVMRITKIDYGELDDGKINIDATQDIYGLGSAVYAAPPPTGWVNPSQPPAAAPNRLVYEAGYYDLTRILGESGYVWSEVDDDLGRLLTVAQKPAGSVLGYNLLTAPAGGSYAEHGSGDFVPTAVLAEAIGKTATVVALTGVVDLDFVDAGTYAILDAETVEVTAVDEEAGTVTLSRGILDTVPADHAAGARIWFCDWRSGDGVDYLGGETVNVKMLTKTGKGILDAAAAPVDSVTFASRMIRPYAPGQFRLNAAAYPDFITGNLAVNWAHRDRLQQTAAYFVSQDDGNIGPEAGTTYTLRIYGESGALLREITGIEGTSYAYALADEIAESGLGRPNESLRVAVLSVRDGYESWQAQDHIIDECRGYGMFYGAYYGE